MSQKNFLKHFTVIGAGTVINMLLGLLSTPVITRIVDPEIYGQFSMFNTYSGIAVMILCLGLDQTLVRYYYEQDDIEYKQSLLYKCVKLPLAFCIVSSAIIILISVTGLFRFEFDSVIIVLLCIFSTTKLFYRFSQLIIRLEYKSKLYSILNIISKAVYIASVYVLLLLFKINHLICLVMALITESVLCLVISILAQKKVWNAFFSKINNCKIPSAELYKYGIPFIFSMGLMTLFEAIDRFSLNFYRSYSEVGVYASTNNIIGLFAIVQTTFNALWAPMAVEHYSKSPNDVSLYQKGNKVITIVMFGIGLTIILCKDVFALLLGAKYRESANILPFLVFHPIMYTISETTVTGITFTKKSKAHIIITFVACITNIVGNTLLVPKIGCQGAAISTGISYIVFFVMRTLISNKYYYVDYSLMKFSILTILTGAYAFYNSFWDFGVISILGYMICIGWLLVAYWRDVKWSTNYLKKELLGLLLKKRHEQ